MYNPASQIGSFAPFDFAVGVRILSHYSIRRAARGVLSLQTGFAHKSLRGYKCCAFWHLAVPGLPRCLSPPTLPPPSTGLWWFRSTRFGAPRSPRLWARHCRDQCVPRFCFVRCRSFWGSWGVSTRNIIAEGILDGHQPPWDGPAAQRCSLHASVPNQTLCTTNICPNICYAHMEPQGVTTHLGEQAVYAAPLRTGARVGQVPWSCLCYLGRVSGVLAVGCHGAVGWQVHSSLKYIAASQPWDYQLATYNV